MGKKHFCSFRITETGKRTLNSSVKGSGANHYPRAPDLLVCTRQGEVTALTLLDLSAVFDTIDHATLTDRLSDWYGISGQAQTWFSSFLQNRHQSVKMISMDKGELRL